MHLQWVELHPPKAQPLCLRLCPRLEIGFPQTSSSSDGVTERAPVSDWRPVGRGVCTQTPGEKVPVRRQRHSLRAQDGRAPGSWRGRDARRAAGVGPGREETKLHGSVHRGSWFAAAAPGDGSVPRVAPEAPCASWRRAWVTFAPGRAVPPGTRVCVLTPGESECLGTGVSPP